jgi:chemotaxis methyl-accepting protein methylase/chemotaxis receptor (MCP) glutamine deamidase CheD
VYLLALFTLQQADVAEVVKELQVLTGLKFDKYLDKFIEKRIYYHIQSLNLNSHEEYLKYLKSNPKEIEKFLERFTINHTFFFRDLEIFKALEKYFRNYKTNAKIRVWSAACATGDEAYTVALILDKLRKSIINFPDFEVIASDIDKRVIDIAKRGKYSEFSLHNTPDQYIQPYFKREETPYGPDFKLDEDLKKKVEFLEEDITLGHRKKNKYNVILCRNLMIYLNNNTRKELLKVIESKLIDGGLLILGLSESLLKLMGNFKSIDIKHRFYIKRSSNYIESHKKQIEKLIKKSKLQKPVLIAKELTSFNEIEYENKINETTFKIEEKKINERIKDLSIEEQLKYIEKKVHGLVKRELIIQERERILSKKLSYLKKKEKEILEKSKNIETILQFIKEQESELDLFIQNMEIITNQIEEKQDHLEYKEKQINHQFNQIGYYTNQLIQKEKLIPEEEREDVNTFSLEIIDQKRIDRIVNPNKDRELNIPVGFYGVLNLYNQNEKAVKFAVSSLGAGIILILKEEFNKIYAISHSRFPNSSASKQGYHLVSPHSFIDTSVKSLLNTMLYHGAEKDKIKAIIIGGARLFNDFDLTFQENIDSIKKELKKNDILTEIEDLGGLSERTIKYDVIHDSLYIKREWEFEFRKIK